MKKQKTKIDIRPYTRQFYKGNIPYFSLAMLAIVLFTVSNLLISWLLQQILDFAGGSSAGFSFKQLIIISLGTAALFVASSMLSYFSKPKFITKGISQYKNYLFTELTRKNISAFSEEDSSTYVSAMTNDIQPIEDGYLVNAFSAFESVALFIGAVAMMLWYSPLLTLVAVLFSALPLAVSFIAGNAASSAEKKVSDCNEAYTSTLRESIGGFAVVKSFKAEARLIRIFADKVKALADAQTGKQKTLILVGMFANLAALFMQFGVFILGAYFVVSGNTITAGTLILFVQLANYVNNPIYVIPKFIAQKKAAKALVLKIAEALNTSREENARVRHMTLEHGIFINGLSFGYEADKPILKNINCSFELGRKYAVVGASGSGKSTLLNLLMASHRNYGGSILYDGTELRDISSDGLYEMESMIQQNVFIFNATVKDNITMFADFPAERIDEVIRLSGLSELVGERGEDYLCGENGSGLSGGEKQRISIARSLLKRSQVLLVDEATSALDAKTAYQVTSEVLSLENITAVVITHSLDSGLLKRYDGIITMKNGEIKEMGTFDELMADKGYFYSLFTVSQ